MTFAWTRGDECSGAIFGGDTDARGEEHYRYLLWRRWQPSKGSVLWIMLNPSTANERVDDPTIRRCLSFTSSWGFGAAEIANVYALRSTDPALLKYAKDPIGPENDRLIADAMRRADRIVVAWGVHAKRERVEQVLRLHGLVQRVAVPPGVPLLCLGTAKCGAPRHPLYIPGARAPVEWPLASSSPPPAAPSGDATS